MAITLSVLGPGGTRDVELTRALAVLGGAIEPVWQLLHDLGLGWCVIVLGAAIVRHQRRTLVSIVVASGIGIALGHLSATSSGEASPELAELLKSIGASGLSTVFPAMRIVLMAAILGAAAPSLTRSMRSIGRSALFIEVVASVALTVTTPVGAVVGLCVGVVAAAMAHLTFGSPGGRPSVAVVRAALRELEVDVAELEPTIEHREGVGVLRGTLTDGTDVTIKLYGRDAIEGRLLASLWRTAWYRDRTASPLVGRRQQVEHEAFLTLLAEQRGVPVPTVVTAGRTDSGDDVLVVKSSGTSCDRPGTNLSSDQVDGLWRALRVLHGIGVAHRRIDPSRLAVRGDGSVAITDWAAASVAAPPDLFLHDAAQLFVTTVLLAGREAAVAALRRARDDEQVRSLLPYLQEPALGRTLRRHIDSSEVEVDELRSELASATGAAELELVGLRRVTWGSLLRLMLLGFAGWLFVSSIADVGFATIVDEISKGDIAWLVAALLVGQLPRFASAFSTIGAAPVALPYGPTAALEFAIAFVNLAVPTSLGRMATKLRFLQRQGIGLAGATAVSALDNLSQFVVQISVLIVTLGLGLGSVELDFDFNLALPEHMVLIAASVLIGLAMLTVAVPPIRRRVMPALVEMRSALGVLRSPAKAAQLLGGNLGAEVLFALTLGVCAHAFAESVSIVDLLVINTLVALFSGLMPVPGGIGVTEAAITAGLGLVGVAPDTAFAIAITNRVCTFYLPPLWGAVALRWLERHRYL
jgi:uncharacterized membrane protein YbhN (UPF0104 family)